MTISRQLEREICESVPRGKNRVFRETRELSGEIQITVSVPARFVAEYELDAMHAGTEDREVGCCSGCECIVNISGGTITCTPDQLLFRVACALKAQIDESYEAKSIAEQHWEEVAAEMTTHFRSGDDN